MAMTLPALALVGASGRIQYSTDPFRTRCERSGSLCEELPGLEAVLSGGADRTVVNLGGFETQVEAVGDASGNRCALLTLAIEPEAVQNGDNPILREPLDNSPAIVWLKDLEGRHIRVNRQFLGVLGGSEDRLVGRTDAELPPAATVDGPRLGDAERSASEPVEFGYTVPAYQDRPALSVVRFLVHGADGEPVAVCGVAAPMAHSEIAEDEAARLMQLGRWSDSDSGSIRADLLEEWGVRLDAPSPDETVSEGMALEQEPAAPDAGLDDGISVGDEAMSQGMEPYVGDADEAIGIAREDADAAMAQAEAARAELEAAQAEVEAARAEVASARMEAESTRVELGGVQAEIAAVRREADAARAEAATAWTEAETERTNAGLLAGQLADARRQLQHQRAQTALAQQQLQIPRCSAAAQASRPASQNGRRIEAAQIALRARKPASQPLDPTLMSQPAPVPVGADSSHQGSHRGGLLGKLRPPRRH